MAKRGNETSHYLDGLTVRGGLEAESYSVGPNANLMLRLPDIVHPVAMPNLFGSGSGTFTANQARGTRVLVPRDGLLVELAFLVTISSGNIDVGVYDCAATTRTRLYSSTSTACAAAGWQLHTMTTPLSVFRGQALDFVLAVDNATASLQGQSMPSTSSQLPSAAWMPVTTDAAGLTAGTTSVRLGWVLGSSFPLPSTLTDASMAAATVAPLILGRLS